MDEVAGRSIDSNNDRRNYLFDNNYSSAFNFVPDSYINFKFEQPVNVSDIYIGKYDNTQDPNFVLNLKLFDKDGKTLLDKNLTQDDLTQKFIHLDNEEDGVASYELKNVGTTGQYVSEFELFGDYGKKSNPSSTINVPISLQGDTYTFYDDAETKSNPVTLSGLYKKQVNATEGYYWNEDRAGFRWYKVSIPELGIENKWFEVQYGDGENIYQYGLFDQNNGTITTQNDVNGQSLIDNDGGTYAIFNPDSVFEYTFNNPVNISKLFIQKFQPNYDSEFKLQIEFLDDNGQVIDTIPFDQNSYFTQFLNIGKTESNVKSIRIKNVGTTAQNITGLELFQ